MALLRSRAIGRSAPDTKALDVPGVLSRLARQRPVFHSEADFQHALAWQIQSEHPEAKVRLETRPERGVRLDLLVSLGDRRIAIEVKYLVALLGTEHLSERFDLPNQGAHDISRYDVVKDIGRVERAVRLEYASLGWVVALSNDPGYWLPPRRGDTIDAAFRLHQGRTLAGALSWGPRAGAGTMRGREGAIDLTGSYRCEWSDYSRVRADSGKGIFRVLALEVV